METGNSKLSSGSLSLVVSGANLASTLGSQTFVSFLLVTQHHTKISNVINALHSEG